MPNWCFNSLLIEGSEKDIADVKAQLNQPFEREHESWNMQTNTMEKKIHKFDNPVFSFWNIRRPTDLEAYNKQSEHKSGQSVEEMFSGNDWYSWNVRNWGTKWDVGISVDDKYPDTELIEEGKDFLLYRFNTAWSPPIPAIEKLSQQYPDLEIELEYEEEQGWGGTTTFANGESTEVESYSARCSNCLYAFANDIPMCDECQAEVCPECNYNLMEGDICEHQLVK